MTDGMKRQVEELFMNDDGALEKELESVKSEDDFLKTFEKHGIKLTLEEAGEIFKELLEDKSDEIDESDLEQVSGGFAGAVVAFTVFAVALIVYKRCKAQKDSVNLKSHLIHK